MICPKCNKFYFKKAYYDRHIISNKCVKKMNIQNNNTEIEDLPLILEDDTKIEEKIVTKKNPEDNNLYDEQINLLRIEINLLKERVKLLEKMECKKDDNTNQTALVSYNINNNNNNNNNNNVSVIKSVKKEKINMDLEIIKYYFNYRDVESDVELLYKCYFENTKKEQYPIKTNKKNETIFWNGEEWIVDNGTNLKLILSHNLRKMYTKVNIVPENNVPSPDYLNNQEHINNLNNKKYQNTLYNLFLEKYV